MVCCAVDVRGQVRGSDVGRPQNSPHKPTSGQGILGHERLPQQHELQQPEQQQGVGTKRWQRWC